MKIRIHLKRIGVYATVTYLPADGQLIFNPDNKSGILKNEYGESTFEVIE